MNDKSKERTELAACRARCAELEKELRELRLASRAEAGSSAIEAERFFDWSSDMLCVAGFDGFFKRVNPAWTKTLGWSEEELLALSWLELIHADDVESTLERGKAVRRGQTIVQYENRYQHKDGGYRWLRWNTVTILEEERFFCVVRDITSEKASQESLRESEEAYRLLFESMMDGFCHHEVILDEEGEPIDLRFLAVNPTFEVHTGLSSEHLLGKTVLEVLPSANTEWVERVARVALTGEPLRFETFSGELRKHLSVLVFSPRPGEVACTFQDISARIHSEEEREQLRAQVEHAQKLESLGVLAGGFAHDFNNLLCAMIGGAEAALLELPSASPIREDLDAVVDTGNRASALCNQMLAYAGRGQAQMEIMDVPSFISHMRPLLTASVSKKAHLEMELDESIPSVLADASQMTQVVLNLVINASEALGTEQGNIRLGVGVRACTQACLPDLHFAEGFEVGDYVYLSVEDDGCGMSPETVGKIFDPFFTTKFTGRGLGLAAILGIIRGHSGALRVDSSEGRGTTFTVFLPRREGEAPVPKSNKPTGKLAGRGLALIADDEPAVNTMLTRSLTRMGFEVVSARNGVEALSACRAYEGRLSLMLLDVTMPEMSGLEVLEHISPAAFPVVLMSGYTDSAEAATLAHGFLAKPFSLSTLREVLASALERVRLQTIEH